MSTTAQDPRGRRHPMTVVAHARRLHTAGWNPCEIARILAGEGVTVTHHTVRRWVDPKTARTIRERNEADRVARKAWTFRINGGNVTDEYAAALIRRLRAEHVTWQNVARVCRVLIGGRWTVDHCKRLAEQP